MKQTCRHRESDAIDPERTLAESDKAIGFWVRDNENRPVAYLCYLRGAKRRSVSGGIVSLQGLTMLVIDDFVGSTKDVETLVDPILGALLNGIESHPPAALQTFGSRRGCDALRDQMKWGEIARRGDDGVDREGGLQYGQDPTQHLKTDHTNPRDDLPCQEHPN